MLRNINPSVGATTLGYDSLFRHANLVKEPQKYPPYDLVKLTETRYDIVLAVAGFKKENIKIALDSGLLTVSGSYESRATEEPEKIVYSGIAKRNFELKFQLSEYLEIQGAILEDGILTIKVEKIIPEDKKPKLIEIG